MALVEIMVSAMLLIIVAIGVFTAFDAGTRATAEERHRARAHDLAEADLARMQSMRIAELATLNETKTVTQDGLDYTIDSRAQFVNEPASTATCASGTGSRDYLSISSTVTWPSIGSRPPVTVSSLVSPPNGSVVPNAGSLLVSVKDSRAAGISGVALSGSGAGSFSGTTGATGCVLWRNLPAGNYTMSIAGAASGMVDPDGDPPEPQPVSVVAQSTNTVNLEYDSPGSIQSITFRTRDYSENLVTSSADTVIIDNTGMTVAKTFGTPGSRVASITTTSTLFPFISPYSVYAGTCGENNPDPATAAPALGSATVPVGGSGSLASPGYIQLPALQVTLMSGSSSSNPGIPVQGGDISVEDDNCDEFTRVLTTSTDSNGQVPSASVGNIGLPYSDRYDVCANNANQNDRRIVNNFELTDAGSAGTDLTIYLGGTSGGSCPP